MSKRIPGLTLLVMLATATAARGGALPTWDKKIDGTNRFKVLSAFAGEAVLDKETGLVWEKTASLPGNWRTSLRFCALQNTGGRMGWRLPALEELLTLVDPTQSTPALPAGAPFQSVLGNAFWTANLEESDPTTVVTVSLDSFGLFTASKTSSHKVLCVRAGRGSATATRGGL